jgi:hypothetical protein
MGQNISVFSTGNTSFIPINIYGVRAETLIGLDVKWLLFMSNFSPNWNGLTHFDENPQ